MATLCERLEAIPYGGKGKLISVLLIPYTNAYGVWSYINEHVLEVWKYTNTELSDHIAGYLRKQGVDVDEKFASKLYYAFNAKKGFKKRTSPLIDIINGQVIGDHIGKNIWQQLNQWEAIYFLAGLYNSKSGVHFKDRFTKTKLRAWSVKKTIAWTMLKGVEKLNKYGKNSRHEKSLGKALPHKAEIYQACKDIVYPQQEIVEKKQYKKKLNQIITPKRKRREKIIPDYSAQLNLFQNSANPQ